jgi:hypothetical protein
MTENAILARFSKCGGDLHRLSRRFHNLAVTARRRALELIQQGTDPAKAISRAAYWQRQQTAK